MRLFSLIAILLLSSSAFSETTWQKECNETLIQNASLKGAVWVWNQTEIFPETKAVSRGKYELKGFTSRSFGVVKLDEQNYAFDGECKFSPASGFETVANPFNLPLKSVGKILDSKVLQARKIYSSWINTGALGLIWLHNQLADELDSLFGDTVDEGDVDANVDRHNGKAVVSCNPRLTGADKRLVLYCKFAVKVVPLSDELGEDPAYTTCEITYKASEKLTSLGFRVLERNDDETTTCLENASNPW